MNNESLKLLSLYLKYHVDKTLDATEVCKDISHYLSPLQMENWNLFFVCHTILNIAHEQQKITSQQYQILYQYAIKNCDGKWIARVYWPEELEKIASHLYQQKIWNSHHVQQCTNLLKTLPGSTTQTHNSTVIEQQQMFHHYYIEKELGRGGMGVVYKARDTKLDRYVAIKVITATQHIEEKTLQRFVLEIKSMAQINHENVVRLFEVGEKPFPYFTMEYVCGSSLAHYIKKHRPNAQQIAEIMRKVSLAIGAAHDLDILHRDLKPDNIMVDDDHVPKVMDFGLAKTQESKVSVTSEVVGTAYYMSPEQANGDVVDKKSDIYSLGATLYEILCGRPPFQGTNFINVAQQIFHDDPIPPSKLIPDVARGLESICLKCLEKDKNKRYATVKELAQDLQNFIQHKPLIAKPPGVIGRLYKWSYRNRMKSAILCAVLMVLTTIVFFTYQKWLASLEIEKMNISLQEAYDNIHKAKLEKEQALIVSQKKLAQSHINMAHYQVAIKNFISAKEEFGTALQILESLPDKDSESLQAEIFLDMRWLQSNAMHLLKSYTFESREDVDLNRYGSMFACFNNNSAYVYEAMDYSFDGNKLRPKSAVIISPFSEKFVLSPTKTQMLCYNYKNVLLCEATRKTPIEFVKDRQTIMRLDIDIDSQWCVIKRDFDIVLVNIASQKAQYMKSAYRNSHRTPIVFSHDGKFLAGILGGMLYIWEQKGGEFVEKASFMTMGYATIYSLAFSPDNKFIAYGDKGGSLYLTDIESSSTKIAKFHTHEVRDIFFHPSGRLFATASRDGKICLWDLKTLDIILQVQTGEDNYKVRFSQNGRTLIAVSGKSSMHTYRVWEIESLLTHNLVVVKKHYRMLEALQKSLRSLESLLTKPLCLSNDDRFCTGVFSIGVSLWDTKTERNRIFFMNDSIIQQRNVSQNVFSPQSKWLGILYQKSQAAFVDLESYKVHYKMDDRNIEHISFVKENIAIVHNRRRLQVWDILHKKKLSTYSIPRHEISELVTHPKSAQLVFGTHDGKIVILKESANRIAISEELQTPHREFIELLNISPQATYISFWSEKERCIILYKNNSQWKIVKKIPVSEKIYFLSISPDERYMAIVLFSKIIIYDLLLDHSVETMHGYYKNGAAAISPSWNRIAVPTVQAGIVVFKTPIAK